ncbi:hypothetical protein HK405_013139, partial [Cladochytrium tenue]
VAEFPSWLIAPNFMIAILTGVVATLLAFRLNQAYDRFWEARKQWGTFQQSIRNMARLMSLHFPADSHDQSAQKLAAMKLLIGFPAAVKHHLRGEHGFDFEDMKQVEPCVTVRKVYNIRSRWRVERLKTASSLSEETISEHSPLLRAKTTTPAPFHLFDYSCSCVNIPIAIVDQLAILIAAKSRAEEIPGPVAVTLQSMLNSLIEAFTSMDRILATRIPLSYGLHLREVLIFYCLFLPFQVIQQLGWNSVTLVSVVVFSMFGIAFGYDPDDLPLDRYCEMLRAEVEDYMFNPITLDAYTPTRFDADAFLHSVNQELLDSVYADQLASSAQSVEASSSVAVSIAHSVVTPVGSP